MGIDLRLRIVASKLFKCFGEDISIKISNHSVCDLIVENGTEHFRFGVKVGGRSFTTSKEFNDYIKFLQTSPSQAFEFPLIVACANINTEEVRVGMLSSVHYGELIIYQNPQLVVLNERNGTILYDNIKSLDGIIRILRNDKWGIVKDITVAYNIQQVKVSARLIYMRILSDQYKFQSPKLEKEKNKFERFLFGINQQEYPQDLLDNIILRGVKLLYPEAKISVKSSLFLFNTELRELNNRISSYKEPKKITFQIEPDIDKYILQKVFFTPFQLLLDLYIDQTYKKEIWKDETVIVPLDNNDWKLFSENFIMKNSIRNISSFLIGE